MRILVVGENFPWPAHTGGLLRLANVVGVLAEQDEVDLFALCDHRRTDRTVPPGIELNRVATVPYPRRSAPLRWRAEWLLQGRAPMEVVMCGRDPEPARALAAWAAPPYDLVWFSMASTYVWCGRPDLGTTVVDLVDLEDAKERQRAALLRAGARGKGRSAWLRATVASAQAQRNARTWTTLQRSVAGNVDAVSFATELDVARSRMPNARAVITPFERPDERGDHEAVGDPPTVLFQGTFNYEPNVDAAGWLTGAIAPLLRARVPGVRIRLVGRPNPAVARLDDPPRVTVTGWVEAMEPELARADLVAVPLRYGSGIRVKILESFANRIPVVSTPIGADGLDVDDGVHLLLADDAESFAAACERVLTEPWLRTALVDAAEARYLERYQRPASVDQIRAVVHAAVGAGSRS